MDDPFRKSLGIRGQFGQIVLLYYRLKILRSTLMGGEVDAEPARQLQVVMRSEHRPLASRQSFGSEWLPELLCILIMHYGRKSSHPFREGKLALSESARIEEITVVRNVVSQFFNESCVSI
jgi:hypothetical protein